MCTYIGIGIRGEVLFDGPDLRSPSLPLGVRGDVSIEEIWPFEGPPEPLQRAGIPAPPGRWRFFEIGTKHCHCGTAVGATFRSTRKRKTPKGWERWSEGKRARWIAETEAADVRDLAVSDDRGAELNAWAKDLRGMLANPRVTAVGVFHQFGSHLLEEPVKEARRVEGDLATRLGDLPEDVLLWIER